MVFALLCADLYVLPVAGVLPTPFLRAPLDFGTPAFYAARACEVDALWTQIRAGHAFRMGCEAWSTWAGVQMSGARWRRFEPEDVLPWLGRLEPGVLIALLEAILTQGRAAAAGIPDLLVYAPSAVRLTAAFPSRVPEGSCFVEVKGPGDSLRDAQRAWHHRLRRVGGRVEVLWVT